MSMEPNTELINLVNGINASLSDGLIEPPEVVGLPPNPFVGLRPFESDEDVLFFGRREQTIELLQQLSVSRFLAVIGSSGSGKSSLIRAGLIPKLKAGFLVDRRRYLEGNTSVSTEETDDERDQWHIAVMRPGDSPLYNLALAVQKARDPDASDSDAIKLTSVIRAEGAPAIIQRLSPLILQRDVNLFLLVDQFEEIFRFGSHTATEELPGNSVEAMQKRDDASEFVALMLELATHPKLPVYVVMTMRSDFLGDCDAFYGLPEAMNRSQYLVPRLTRQQRQEAIEKPILLFNERIAPRLRDRVLNDMGESPDQLPIMQHAMMRTWEAWKASPGGELDLKHYESAGTIANALWKDAEKALSETGEPELTKRIFQLLTGKDQHGRRIRRPAYLTEIENVTRADRKQIMGVIDCFRRNNRSFLILSEGKNQTETLVDISHESLIRQWKTLRDWVDEEAESRAMYLRIAEASGRHAAGDEGLWTNPALRLALDWRAQKNPNEAWGQRYHPHYLEAMAFLDKSRKRSRFKKLFYFAIAALIPVLLLIWGADRLRARQEIVINQRSLAASDFARREAEKQRTRAEEALKQLRDQLVKTETAVTEARNERAKADEALKETEAQRAKAETAAREATRQRDIAQQAVIKEQQARAEERQAKEKVNAASENLTLSILQGLKPEAFTLALKLIEKARERGLEIRLISGYRSLERQKELRDLYLQGRGNLAGEFSIHNTGLAFDISIVKDGVPVDRGAPEYDIVGHMGEELGLVWGDRIHEKWHFETTNAKEELEKLRATKNN